MNQIVTLLQDTYVSIRSLVDPLQPAAFSSPCQRFKTECVHFKPAIRYLWKPTTSSIQLWQHSSCFSTVISSETYSSYGLVRIFWTKGKRSTQQPIVTLGDISWMLQRKVSESNAYSTYNKSLEFYKYLNNPPFGDYWKKINKHTGVWNSVQGQAAIIWILQTFSRNNKGLIAEGRSQVSGRDVFYLNLRKYAKSSPTFLCQSVEDTFSLRFLPDSTSVIVLWSRDNWKS